MNPEILRGLIRYVAVAVAGLFVSVLLKYQVIEAATADAEAQKIAGYLADLLGAAVTLGLAWWHARKHENRVDAALNLEAGSTRTDLEKALRKPAQPVDPGEVSPQWEPPTEGGEQ